MQGISLTKVNPLLPAEDYNALRKQGFKAIEKLGSDNWTDYNNSDPGITILEAVCYAITDLSYRTGFDIKDLLAPEQLTNNTWKQIFYTARQILHNTALTINDYRKIIIDTAGVRNAWIEKSKDYEVPVWIDYNYPDVQKDADCSCGHNEKVCYGDLKIGPVDKAAYKESFVAKLQESQQALNNLSANATDQEKAALDKIIEKIQWQIDQLPAAPEDLLESKIVEFEGLYNVMIEYESGVQAEEQKKIKQNVTEKLAHNRNLCEDFIAVTDVTYEDFGIGAFIVLQEYADPDEVLAELFFTIYKYFTPSIPFYTIPQMMDKGYLVDEIFEGPALKHGFIDDNDLERTNLFRDIRLSDIINEVADIKGIKAVNYLHLPFAGMNDNASLKNFFNLWIKNLADERKVARIQPEMSQIMFCKERDFITYFMGRSEDRRPNRMLKLFKDMVSMESKYKLVGHQVDFPVPSGEYMDLEDYYPVTYSLPACYGVNDQAGLPSDANDKRKAQALQLKGYLLFFEQVLAGYLSQLNHLRDLFSFDDHVKHNIFTRAIYTATAFNETQLAEIQDLKSLLIDHNNRGADHWDKILEDFTHILQNLLETPKQFSRHRNRFLDHMLARFGENMSEYEAISRWLTPYKIEERLIADKISMLKDGEYYKISTQRAKGYDYTQYGAWGSLNISGAERRVGRLLGFKDVSCRTLATGYVAIEEVVDTTKKVKTNIVKLIDPDDAQNVLFISVPVKDGCCTETLITQILTYADDRSFFKFENGTRQRRVESMYPFWFELYDRTGDSAVLLGKSKEFLSNEERESAFKKIEKLMTTINDNEGLHLVEHILLRPKFDAVLDEENILVPVNFLDVCLDTCDLGIGLGQGTDPQLYLKRISRLAADKCYDEMPWILGYFKIPFHDNDKSFLFQKAFEDGSEPTPLKFKKYELLTKRVLDLQQYGAEIANYRIVSNQKEQLDITNTRCSFIIVDEQEQTLAQSDFIYTQRTDKQKEEGVPPAIDDIDREMERLLVYFGYEMDFYCEEDPCDNNEDPYSFRTTVVLPCWPKRFRDSTFRNLVEKTIQTEFPAHIHTKIVWIGLQEMKEFEQAYHSWLDEMAQNEMPRYEIVNLLVEKLKTLKACGSCNEDCGSAG